MVGPRPGAAQAAARAARLIADHLRTVAAVVLAGQAIPEVLAREPARAVLGPRLVLLCLLAVATTIPLALPSPTAAAAMLVAAGVVSLAGFQVLAAGAVMAQLIAVYRLGRAGNPVVAVPSGLLYLPILLALSGAGESWHVPARVSAAVLAAALPAAALAGVARRIRHDDLAGRAEREAIAGTLLEHSARAERARIARELHDVVAHHVSLVAVQAETARVTTPGMPALGAERLTMIADAARAALTEMRLLLGVLREDAADRPATRQPQPGLAQLTELLDQTREASHTGTRLILHGRPVALDPGAELAAYRIVQEALTNTRRHAPGAAVDVELRYCGNAVRLLIRDNGPGPPPAFAEGHGLRGMRERAAAVGGQLRAGGTTMGGFLVDVTMPVRAEVMP